MGTIRYLFCARLFCGLITGAQASICYGTQWKLLFDLKTIWTVSITYHRVLKIFHQKFFTIYYQYWWWFIIIVWEFPIQINSKYQHNRIFSNVFLVDVGFFDDYMKWKSLHRCREGWKLSENVSGPTLVSKTLNSFFTALFLEMKRTYIENVLYSLLNLFSLDLELAAQTTIYT